MDFVYLIEHVYEADNEEETKFIGISSTFEIARKVVGEYKLLPGFSDYPEGFHIDKCKVNEFGWSEGFIKSKDAL